MRRIDSEDIEITVSLPPHFNIRPEPTTSTPPVSAPRPSVAARALSSRPGKISTKVIKGLTIASGVVGIASTVARVAGDEKAVDVITQLALLLKLIGGLFGG